MKAIILAAGYASRLHPLTIERPKPLLKVNNKPIITYIIEHLNDSTEIDQTYVITNKKFRKEFDNWKLKTSSRIPIKVLSNHTTTSEEKCSAIDNLKLVLDAESIKEDCLVIAGDGIFNFDILPLIEHFKKTNKSTHFDYEF